VAAVNPRRKRLAARLKALRLAAGFGSQQALADAMGWRQSTVSRIEAGEQVPSEDYLWAVAGAVGADEATIAELLNLRIAARTFQSVRDVLRSAGFASYQDRRADIELRYSRIGEFQPAMVPGLLQTEGYARQVLTLSGNQPDVEAALAARVRRQQRVLWAVGKTRQLVVGEAALRVHFGEPGILLEQLDHLAAVTSWDRVEFGIVPDGAWPVFPICSFAVYDEDLAIVESYATDLTTEETEDVEQFARTFEKLRRAASMGDDARALIRRAEAELKG
jgi:transcriptional regulator with XRE-family HTH domain